MSVLDRLAYQLEKDQATVKDLKAKLKTNSEIIDQLQKLLQPGMSHGTAIEIQVSWDYADTWNGGWEQRQRSTQLSSTRFKTEDCKRLIEILELTNNDLKQEIEDIEKKYDKVGS